MTLRNKILLLISILSIAPFGIAMYVSFEFLKISKESYVDNIHRNEVLSWGICDWQILVPFLLFVLIIISVVSVLVIFRKEKNDSKIDKLFTSASFLFGGIAIHIFIWIAFVLTNKWTLKRGAKTFSSKRRFIMSTIGVASISTVMAVPFAASLFLHGEEPFVKDDTVYSTNRAAPNIIEIFSDGFDKDSSHREKSSHRLLNTFHSFDKYITPGSVTDITMPTIFGGFKKFNSAKLYKDNPSVKKLTELSYGKAWFTSGLEHLSMNKALFSSRTLINPICFSDKPDYYSTEFGTPKSIVAADPQLGVVNRPGAREAVIKNGGPTGKAWDWYAYEYAKHNGVLSETATKGARVEIHDLITHPSYVFGEEGDRRMFGVPTHAEQAHILYNQLESYMGALKNRVGKNGVSVFDNSMIIIYGDHTSPLTGNAANDANIDIFDRHESTMFIKYPFQTAGSVITDREVYAPQINGIIDAFMKKKYVNNMDYFNESRFDMRPLPIFAWGGNNNSKIVFASYDTDHIVSLTDTTKLSQDELSINKENFMNVSKTELDKIVRVLNDVKGVE